MSASATHRAGHFAHIGFTGLVAVLLLCCTLTTTTFAAKQKYGDSANASDALFDPSRVIQIEIRLDPKDWHALRVSHPALDANGGISITERGYEYYRGEVVIDGRKVTSVGVRKKGAVGSLNSSRPSLKVKFDEYMKAQEFVGLDMLTLNNCLQDPTKAREFLAYSFMQRAGVPAPRSNLARVTVNGEDLGIYAHVESIRKPFITRFFPNANGDLYENVFNADFTTNSVHSVVHKWGKSDGPGQLKKLVGALDRPGLVSLPEVAALVDLGAFIRFWAAEVLVGHPDGYPTMYNNFYLFRDAVSGKFYFIPSGEDSAFVDRQYGFLKAVPKSVKAMGYLCRRLWELPEIQERYRKEMRRSLDEAWDEKLMLLELERIRRLCRDDRVKNPAEVEKSRAQIVRFVEERRNELQPELEGPAPAWPPLPSDSRPRTAATNAFMWIEGSFSAVITETVATNLLSVLGQGSGKLQFTLNDKTRTPFTRFGVVANTRQGAEEFTIVRMVAIDAAGELRWNFTFSIDPFLMTTGTLELNRFAVRAVLVQGNPEGEGSQRRFTYQNTGTLELTQVSTNLGGTISGKFKINTTAFEEEKKP